MLCSANDLARMRRAEIFGRRVREVRHKRGWTHEQLAFEAGVKRAYLSEVENGQRNVSLDVVERLANALEIGASSLLLEAVNTQLEIRNATFGQKAS